MKKLQGIIRVLLTVAFLLVGIWGLSVLTANKQGPGKYYDFYHDDEQYDVLLCGSSHMMNTVYPMELWKKYGITSYNIANSTETVATSYWVLKNALDYKKPKIVVMEIFLAGDAKVVAGNESFLHIFFDELPLSKNKIDALQDLLGDRKALPEYLFPFFTYHSRWEELDKADFKQEHNRNKGAGAMVGHFDSTEMTYCDEAGKPSETAVTYLKKVKQLCDDNDIKLILMCSPYLAQESEQKNHNAYYQVAQEMGVDYLNLIDKNVIDYEVDLFDRGHCNSAGGNKVTDYLGNYLTQTFGADYFANDAVKEKWDAAYEEYAGDLIQQMKDEAGLYNCLIRLQNPVFAGEITIKEDSDAAKDKIVEKMIQNSGKLEVKYSNKQECDVSIEVKRKGSEEILSQKQFDARKVLSATIKQ